MRHDGELDQERLDKEIRRSVDAVKQLDSIINKQERILAEYNYDIKLAREISRGYEQVNFNDVERRISQLGTSILSFNTLNIWETLFQN